MNENNYIGTGKNPKGKDLPLGFGMRLAQEAAAMQTFSGLTQTQRDNIVNYIQGCTTSEDAINRIENAIEGLKNGVTRF